MNSVWRATPSSYGLLRSRGRKVKSYSVCYQLGTCCLPPSAFSACFTCPLANPRLFGQAMEQQVEGGAAQVSWQGSPNCSKHWSWQGVRVKQVKGCSRLKKRKDGWRTGVGKGMKTVNLSGMGREMVFTSIFFCLRALLLNDKDAYPWFP